MQEGDFGDERGVVESLAQEYDVLDIAAAALKLVNDDAGGSLDDGDIPTADVSSHDDKPRRGAGGERHGDRRPRRADHEASDGPMTVLFIGAGKKMGIRPADLVGAIAGEAGVPSSVIGAIKIAENFSLVEVPQPMATAITAALRQTTLRGQRVTVRRDRDSG